jgi:hypothetical protein
MKFQRDSLIREADALSDMVRFEQARQDRDGIYMLECLRDYARTKNLIDHLNKLGWDQAEFLGATADCEIPVRIGEVIELPPGAPYFDAYKSIHFFNRTVRVKVVHITKGIEKFSDPKTNHVINPMIYWSNGFESFFIDMNYCPKANPEYEDLLVFDYDESTVVLA